jgi:hypothetical protein
MGMRTLFPRKETGQIQAYGPIIGQEREVLPLLAHGLPDLANPKEKVRRLIRKSPRETPGAA